MNIQDQIAVMQHYANGGKVEYKSRDPGSFPRDFVHCTVPIWNWSGMEYRIKKEPRKFKIWITHKGETCIYSSSDNITQLMSVGWELITVTEDV